MITSILILAANMQAAGEVVEAVQPESRRHGRSNTPMPWRLMSTITGAASIW